jgi:hypothetical protein
MDHVAWVEEKTKAYSTMVGKHEGKIEYEDNAVFEISCGYS